MDTGHMTYTQREAYENLWLDLGRELRPAEIEPGVFLGLSCNH